MADRGWTSKTDLTCRLAESLARTREEARVSLSEVADRVGVNPSTIKRWEDADTTSVTLGQWAAATRACGRRWWETLAVMDLASPWTQAIGARAARTVLEVLDDDALDPLTDAGVLPDREEADIDALLSDALYAARRRVKISRESLASRMADRTGAVGSPTRRTITARSIMEVERPSAGRTRRRLTLDEVDLYGCALGMDWREAWDLHQPLIAAVGAEVIRAMWDELVEIDRQRAAAIERLRAVAMSDAPAMPPEHDQVGKWIRIE